MQVGIRLGGERVISLVGSHECPKIKMRKEVRPSPCPAFQSSVSSELNGEWLLATHNCKQGGKGEAHLFLLGVVGLPHYSLANLKYTTTTNNNGCSNDTMGMCVCVRSNARTCIPSEGAK